MTNIIEPDTKFTPRISSNLEPQIDWAHASVILGRDRQAIVEFGLEGTMNLGVVCEHQTTGASLFGYQVLFDNKFPHIIFICGKRGSGKSYTLGVIVEELGRSNSGIGTIVVDPLGTFWTMKNKNKSKKADTILPKYGLFPKDFKNIQVMAPIGFYEDMRSSVDGAFSIAVSDLTVDDWCLVFDINRFKTQGLLIGDVLDKIMNGYDAIIGDVTKKVPPKSIGYTIGDIIFCIQHDASINSSQEGYALATRRSVIARFRSAAKWGIFSVKGTPINQISKRNKITVLDVSHSKLGSSRRALIVGILARRLLEARIECSRSEEASSMGLTVASKELIPVTWLIIDEAHLLLPASGKTPATESLIEYAKLGRKPGCGLVFATQRPSATNDEILSQVDTILGHNLALEDDIAALRRRIPAKMPLEFSTSDFIRGMPVGVCLVADQKTQKRTMLVQIRPRMTHHSGKAAMPKKELEGIDLELDKGKGELVGDALEPSAELDLELEMDSTFDTSGQDVQDDIMKPSLNITLLSRAEEFDDETIKVDDFETAIDDVIDDDIIDIDNSSKKGKKDVVDTTLIKADTKKTKLEKQIEPSTNQIDEGQDQVQDVEWGGAYLILTKGSKFVLNLFSKLSKSYPNNSLSITRTHPNKFSKDLPAPDFSKFWLSKTTDENSIPPGNITKIAHIINEHLKTNDNSLVLLDGLEYLITNNDFPKILKFIESVHEKIVVNNGILLLPINPATLGNKDFELLENELVNTIKDPSYELKRTESEGLEGKSTKKEGQDLSSSFDHEIDKEKDGELKHKELEPVDEGPHGKPLKFDTEVRIKSPTKDDLIAMCTKLGLKTTGSVDDLKKRLLDYDSDKPTELPPPEAKARAGTIGTKGTKGPTEPKVITKNKKEDIKITKREKEIMKLLEEERKSLLEEHKKMKTELTNILDKERQKLEHEKELLKEERDRIQKTGKKENGMPNKDKLSKPGKQIKRVPPGLTNKRTKPHKLEDLELVSDPKLRAKEGLTAPIEKIIEHKTGKKRTIKTTTSAGEKQMLLVKAGLKGNSVLKFAQKQLKTTLLGKPVEGIDYIKPVYLPLIRIYIKTMRGSIFAKEYSGKFYWDCVTGEFVMNINDVIKRSKGVSILLRLPPDQAKVLMVMDTWGNNDVVDIQNDVDIPMSKLKRALTELKKRSYVTAEFQKEDNLYNYKRKIELKFPKKLEKIKVDLPRIIQSNIFDTILHQNYKLSELQKWINNVSPGTRIIKTEEVFYPYFELKIIGKTGPRVLYLDANSGENDELLTEVMNLQ